MITALLLIFFSCQQGPDTSHLEKDVLHLEVQIPLPKVKGRIDHMSYDSAGHRLFVAAVGNNSVEVVDLKKRILLRSISGISEPQGISFIPNLHRLAVSSGGSGDCIFYEDGKFQALGAVSLNSDADNIRYDGQHVLVGYGKGGIAVIDPGTINQVADLKMKGHPESFQLGDSGKLFINIPDEGEIALGDLRGLTVTTKWKNAGASANYPMALDEAGRRLFIGYRQPGEVHVLNAHTGELLASFACVGDADDLFYDAADSLLFVSGGEGFLDVFRGNTLINHIPTRKGARTSLWLPGERKLILAVPARGSEPAALWVYSM